MMGVWFLSVAVGDIIAGWTAGLFSTMPLPRLFGTISAAMFAAGVILALLVRPIQRLMGGVQ
jgi:POT family proton-dependent oligopeptide transporter